MFKLFREPQTVYAHCDIPCGIYDPHAAQLAALTIIRMTDLIGAGQNPHDITRYTVVKEEHTEKCKHEVRVIWGDYFREEHLQKHPELHGLVYQIMQAASKARQTSDRTAAVELLELVNKFAEIFWETKGVQTKRVKSPQKIEEEIVYPML
ncbi:MAG: superoxide dismutase, Ni [Candidatus Colwellbacteria bacterium]|nr:superoxide dismutase, Ni [Candidatus Colwellbacteria bacterium]